MAQEGQNQRHSNNKNNDSTISSTCVTKTTSSSKRLKHKKVPQRGLGVAQLEKIRLEEQRKKEATVRFSPISITTSSSTISPTSSSSSYLPLLPASNFNPTQTHSSALIPFPPPSQTAIPSPDSSLFRSGPSTCAGGADSNVYDSGCVQLPNLANGGTAASGGGRGVNVGWTLPITAAATAATTVMSHGNVPKFWNSEYGSDLEGENPNLKIDHHHHHGLAFHEPNLPYDRCNPSWPLPIVMHRTQQSPQPPHLLPPPPPPPMVIKKIPSLVLNFCF